MLVRLRADPAPLIKLAIFEGDFNRGPFYPLSLLRAWLETILKGKWARGAFSYSFGQDDPVMRFPYISHPGQWPYLERAFQYEGPKEDLDHGPVDGYERLVLWRLCPPIFLVKSGDKNRPLVSL